MVRQGGTGSDESRQETLRAFFISSSTSRASVSIRSARRTRTEGVRVIVKILEVWFLISVPIGITVGRVLERGSTPLVDATPQVARVAAHAER